MEDLCGLAPAYMTRLVIDGTRLLGSLPATLTLARLLSASNSLKGPDFRWLVRCTRSTCRTSAVALVRPFAKSKTRTWLHLVHQ